MLYEIIYYLWGFNTLNERKKRRKNIVVCVKCEAEWPKAVRFCGKCGGKQLLSIPDFEKLEDQRYKQRSIKTEDANKRDLVRYRIQELKAALVCNACNTYFEPSLAFCSNCGGDIAGQKISDENIFQIVQPEFPNLIQSYDDYLQLIQTKEENDVSLGTMCNDFYRWWRR